MYYGMFFSPYRSILFSEKDNECWKLLTDVPLLDYNKKSLVSTEKPNIGDIRYISSNCPKIGEMLKQKYHSLVESSLQVLDDFVKSISVQRTTFMHETFGIEMSFLKLEKTFQQQKKWF
jgi:hypothetical protein